MKRILLFLALSMVLVLSACGNNESKNGTDPEPSNGTENQSENQTENQSENTSDDEKSYQISITQYLEHPSLNATRDGFIDALKDAGIEEGKNLTVLYNNAQGESTNNVSIAQKIAGDESDLVYAISTPSAAVAASQVKDTPLLFAAVTDPIDAKLVEDLEEPEANITGAADTNPEASVILFDFIAKHMPEIKQIGMVINRGEPNSVIMAERAEEILAGHGISLIQAAITNTSEVQQAVDSLVGQADAFFIALDNSVVEGVSAIIQVANDQKIPFFSSDRDTVEAGAFATVGFKYYDHGYQSGEMAVEILKNGKKPSELPVTFPDQLDLILNLEAANAQGIEVTEEMKAEVKDPETNIIE